MKHLLGPRRPLSPFVFAAAGLIWFAPVLRAQSTLSGLSTRATVPVAGVSLSFRVDGAVPKAVLIRAGGPSLAKFGLTGTLADPRLSLTNAVTGAVVVANDDWGAAANVALVIAATSRVGASPYDTGSKDAAILATVEPGSYQVTVTGANGGTGAALLEVFSADTTAGSTFGYLATTQSGFTLAGINLTGTGSRSVLVRAVGPGLAATGVTGVMADPSLTLSSSTAAIATNNDWGGTAALATMASQVGGVALVANSRDSAVLSTLTPGTYTAQASGGAGLVRLEIFDAGPINTAPTIATAPAAVRANLGGPATFTVRAAGSLPFTYQWQKNGAAIAGASGATYTIAAAQGGDAGNYSVVVTNATGTVTSTAAALSVITGKIVNLSVRTNLAAAQTLSVGFYANAPKSLLIRAVGPALAAAPFNLTGMIADPRIDIFDSAGSRVDGNDNWSPALLPVFTSVAAFPFPADSRDAALQRSISGATTMQINGTGAGLVLVETYDTSGSSPARLTNVSARNRVGTDDNILVAGFVIGDGGLRVLIRGVGPALGLPPFGLPGVLADAKLEIYNSANAKVAENDNWEPGLAAAFASVAAFALPNGSRDAALIATLPAGAYTAQLSGVGGTTGEGIIEVYELP